MKRKNRGVSTKAFALILAVVLLIGCVAGGTIAWLVAKTQTVTNTFTYGKVGITLTETAPDGTSVDLSTSDKTVTGYTIVPGVNITKNPTVAVEAGSEACYLFVKVAETNWPETTKISYDVAEGWTALAGETGVYYREVDASQTGSPFAVIANNTITVSGELTKEEIADFNANPSLAISAYAVQKAGSDDAAAAWDKIN